MHVSAQHPDCNDRKRAIIERNRQKQFQLFYQCNIILNFSSQTDNKTLATYLAQSTNYKLCAERSQQYSSSLADRSTDNNTEKSKCCVLNYSGFGGSTGAAMSSVFRCFALSSGILTPIFSERNSAIFL